MDGSTLVADLFGVRRALLGVVHAGALPGTPRANAGIEEIVAQALRDARVYREAGFHGLVLENMHDRPYLKRGVGPEITAAMTAVGCALRREVPLPLGVQVLAGANREAFAVALACGAAFVRVEGFVFAHTADEGLIESDAGELLRYRRAIGADGIRVFADVKKKHSAHALTADVDLVETARAAEFFLADGVIVTGTATGQPTSPEDLEQVAAAVSVPVLVGSGISAENVGRYAVADALIVGSSVKHGGHWSRPVDPERARDLATAWQPFAGT